MKKNIFFIITFYFFFISSNSFAGITVKKLKEKDKFVRIILEWVDDNDNDTMYHIYLDDDENRDKKHRLSFWEVDLFIEIGTSEKEGREGIKVWIVTLRAYHKVRPSGDKHDSDSKKGEFFYAKKEFGLSEEGIVIEISGEDGKVQHPNHYDQYYFKFDSKKSDDGYAAGAITLNGDHLAVHLVSFNVTHWMGKNYLYWLPGLERNNAGFRIWRSIDKRSNEYENISTLEKSSTDSTDLISIPLSSGLSNLIPTKGKENANYSFIDTDVYEDDAVFYYLIEDINFSGQRTFHCKDIQAIMIGQGPTIDLEATRNFCENQCLQNTDNNIICK